MQKLTKSNTIFKISSMFLGEVTDDTCDEICEHEAFEVHY